jgi:hypothetical protein
LGIGAPSPSVNGQDRPTFVIGASQELLQLPLIQGLVQLGDAGLGFGKQGFVRLLDQQF